MEEGGKNKLSLQLQFVHFSSVAWKEVHRPNGEGKGKEGNSLEGERGQVLKDVRGQKELGEGKKQLLTQSTTTIRSASRLLNRDKKAIKGEGPEAPLISSARHHLSLLP